MERDGVGVKFIEGNGEDFDLQITKRVDLVKLVFNWIGITEKWQIKDSTLAYTPGYWWHLFLRIVLKRLQFC